ncbi:MAG TPA: SDR family NAD(P)-dependent oxidoreductase [Kofleriaceae bacterium]|jgi:NAD(P)-dependent dehydrogenase (short-subunit alcohol dehydrogenase family)|nr:SDR family NAD(P)-dependent oxidoreductase [Kofleriaceae bacterium]
MSELNWFITGSSRGLGKSLVRAAAEAGHRVIATARTPGTIEAHGDRVIPLALDVTDPAAARAAVAAALDRVGRIDVVVNNAGQGFFGAFEEMTAEQFDAQVAINFTGVVNVTRAVLPVLRRQRSGHIIQVSSVGGRIGAPGLSAYQASKFAVEGLSEVLWHELKPLGIKVTIVEPGGFRTDWAGSSMAWADPIDDYNAVRAFRESVAKRAGGEPGDPDRGARAIVELATMADPPLRQPLGTDSYTYLKLAYESNLAELERAKAHAVATDFPGSAAPDLGKLFDRRES